MILIFLSFQTIFLGYGDEPISSFEEASNMDTRASGSDVSTQPMTPSSNEGASPAVHTKRRRDRSTALSRFCEQVDPGGKGQVSLEVL